MSTFKQGAAGNDRTGPTAAENAILLELLASDIAAKQGLAAGWNDEAARAWFDSLYETDFPKFRRLLAELVVFRDRVGKADPALQTRYAGLIRLAEIAEAVFFRNRRLEAAVFGAPLH